MADAPILIDRTKCTGCGKCVKGCGFGALKLVEAPGANKLGRVAEVDPSACKACSACVKACPFHAISEAKAEIYGTEGIEDYRDIWVFAEQNHGMIAEVAFELLGKGLELKAQRGDGCRLCAVLLGSGLTDAMMSSLTEAGADVVYAVDDPKLADYDPNVYVDAVAQLVFKHKPEVILAGATAIGRAFFARVAVKVRTGLTADCTALKIEGSCKTSVSVWEGRALSRPRTGRSPSLPRFCNCHIEETKVKGKRKVEKVGGGGGGGVGVGGGGEGGGEGGEGVGGGGDERVMMLLHQTRPAFGGNIMATIMTPNHRPQMATVRPKVFKRRTQVEKVGGGGECTVVREILDLIEPKTHLKKVVKDPDAVDIASASVLVAGGRGLKNATNFVRLFELAQLLGGEVAASRAAVDAGWTPVSRQVGQTGKAVAPKLYLCFGISGAIQHLEGIRGADKIIAVNNDPNAPIFGVADLGIVGDAAEIIPALIRALTP